MDRWRKCGLLLKRISKPCLHHRSTGCGSSAQLKCTAIKTELFFARSIDGIFSELRFSSSRMGFLACRKRFNSFGKFGVGMGRNSFAITQRRAISNSWRFNNGEETLLPVLIVGAGPVGLVLSTLLTKLGVKCAILERSTSFSNHPQAHFINNRTMEVFRKLNGLAEEIQRSEPPVDSWRKFIYCTSLCGTILGTVDHFQPQDFERVVSPISVAHFSQYKLTELLLRRLEDIGFHLCLPEESKGPDHQILNGREIMMGHECVSIDENDDFLIVTASYLKEGKYVKRTIHCNVLVGADGAGSTVRKLVGIKMEGQKDLQKLVSVHFFSSSLGQYLLNERPGMLYFIFNTEAIGVLVAHDLEQGEFVLQIPFYPPQQKLEDFTPKTCEKLIFNLVGRELGDVYVKGIKPWVMHAEVAEKFTGCHNRLILAGDAAHRFPPAGGFGMNTGIQDAHNLAWKLASVVQGIASSSILKTYEVERRPIALFNTSLSVKNFRAAMEVPAALGLDPKVANSVHQLINKSVGSILPLGLQSAILDGIFKIGRAQLSRSFLDEKNPIGSARLSKLKRIFDEGKSLQLQFPAEDLGFRYRRGAIIPDEATLLDIPEIHTGRRREYTPSADPGSRLPHMKLKILSVTPGEETISTLDLVSGDKVEFLLIIAPKEESYQLALATFKVAEEFKVSTKTCIIWPAGLVGGELRSKEALTPWENYVDVVEIKALPTLPSWWENCQMTDTGAILVRPDDHVAWRVRSGLVDDPFTELRRVFSALLK